MRCPPIFCNDSEKNQHKARGYIFQKKGAFFYYCHNCSTSLSFPNFLKALDKGLYDQYLLERFQDEKLDTVKYEKAQNKKLDNKALNGLKSLAQLFKTHRARKYIESRKLPKWLMEELYFTEEFKAWTNQLLPGKFELNYEEERIIIPFFDSKRLMFGYQGRSLDPNSKIRYIAIMLDESKPKLWGLHRVDFNRKFFVCEGPFDASFLSNSLATGGGNIGSELYQAKCDIDRAVIVYDNEPRNPQVATNIHKSIAANYSVVIWPENLPHKDINELVLAGYKPEQIEQMLHTWTVRGLKAELEFARWKKHAI